MVGAKFANAKRQQSGRSVLVHRTNLNDKRDWFWPLGLVVDFDSLQPPGVGYRWTSSRKSLIEVN